MWQPALQYVVPLLLVERFVEAIVDAGGEQLAALAGRGIGGEGNDRCPPSVAFLGAHPPGGFQTVQGRHVLVHQHEIERVPGEQRQRFAAVVTGRDAQPRPLEKQVTELQAGRVIVHHHDARLMCG